MRAAFRCCVRDVGPLAGDAGGCAVGMDGRCFRSPQRRLRPGFPFFVCRGGRGRGVACLCCVCVLVCFRIVGVPRALY